MRRANGPLVAMLRWRELVGDAMASLRGGVLRSVRLGDDGRPVLLIPPPPPAAATAAAAAAAAALDPTVPLPLPLALRGMGAAPPVEQTGPTEPTAPCALESPAHVPSEAAPLTQRALEADCNGAPVVNALHEPEQGDACTSGRWRDPSRRGRSTPAASLRCRGTKGPDGQSSEDTLRGIPCALALKLPANRMPGMAASMSPTSCCCCGCCWGC